MILSRRGAFGLAALLGIVARPAPVRGVVPGKPILGELRLGVSSLPVPQVVSAEFLNDCTVEINRIVAPGGPHRVGGPSSAPAGWDTLENVR